MVLLMCFICPPMALLMMGRPFQAIYNCFLVLFLVVPAISHALANHEDWTEERRLRRIENAVHMPKWFQLQSSAQEAVPQHVEPEQAGPATYNSPHIGVNGTMFEKR